MDKVAILFDTYIKICRYRGYEDALALYMDCLAVCSLCDCNNFDTWDMDLSKSGTR